jgi:hypothetical protein
MSLNQRERDETAASRAASLVDFLKHAGPVWRHQMNSCQAIMKSGKKNGTKALPLTNAK